MHEDLITVLLRQLKNRKLLAQKKTIIYNVQNSLSI